MIFHYLFLVVDAIKLPYNHVFLSPCDCIHFHNYHISTLRKDSSQEKHVEVNDHQAINQLFPFCICLIVSYNTWTDISSNWINIYLDAQIILLKVCYFSCNLFLYFYNWILINCISFWSMGAFINGLNDLHPSLFHHLDIKVFYSYRHFLNLYYYNFNKLIFHTFYIKVAPKSSVCKIYMDNTGILTLTNHVTIRSCLLAMDLQSNLFLHLRDLHILLPINQLLSMMV